MATDAATDMLSGPDDALPSSFAPFTGTAPTRPLIRAPGWRTRLHAILNRPSESREGLVVRAVTLFLIVLSTLCFVLQSLSSVAGWPGWQAIDIFVAVVFTVEYGARLLVAPDGRGDEDEQTDPTPADACQARLRFAKQPMSIVDLVAIAPFWLGLLLQFAPLVFLQLLRALRLVRVLRLLRLAQHSAEVRALARCFMRSLPALRMLLVFLSLELLIVGGLVFHAELGGGELDGRSDDGVWCNGDPVNGVCEEVAVFQSIPDAAWWTLVTVTTVGYGRQVPETVLGKLIACFAMLSGLIGISSIVSIITAETQAYRSHAGGILSSSSAPAATSSTAHTFPEPTVRPLALPIVAPLPSASAPSAVTPVAVPSSASTAATAAAAAASSSTEAAGAREATAESPEGSAELDGEIREAMLALGALLERKRTRGPPALSESLRGLHDAAFVALTAFEKVSAAAAASPH